MTNTLDAYLTTTDGSEVVNDLSAPQINTRQISSNNSNSNYAKVGDTVWVNFTANEPLIPGSISSQILGRTAMLYSNQGDQTISYYIVPNDSDSQGLIGFQILAFRDYAGNSGTVPVTSTTDGSSITFDRTNPDTMTINNVIATGGTVVENYWNSTNNGISITVNTANDASLNEGLFQILTMVNGNNAGALGTYSLSAGDIGISKTVAGQENFEELSQLEKKAMLHFMG